MLFLALVLFLKRFFWLLIQSYLFTSYISAQIDRSLIRNLSDHKAKEIVRRVFLVVGQWLLLKDQHFPSLDDY